MKRLYIKLIEELKESEELELSESEEKELRTIGEEKTAYHTVTPHPPTVKNKFLHIASKHGLDTSKIRKGLDMAIPT